MKIKEKAGEFASASVHWWANTETDECHELELDSDLAACVRGIVEIQLARIERLPGPGDFEAVSVTSEAAAYDEASHGCPF